MHKCPGQKNAVHRHPGKVKGGKIPPNYPAAGVLPGHADKPPGTLQAHGIKSSLFKPQKIPAGSAPHIPHLGPRGKMFHHRPKKRRRVHMDGTLKIGFIFPVIVIHKKEPYSQTNQKTVSFTNTVANF
jgi:hypothetical protein